jgi:hypothetical protein
MKKIALMAAIALGGLTLTGCVNGVATNQGFPVAQGGLIYTQIQGATLVQERPEAASRPYQVVKNVGAKSTTTNIMGLVATGDASYNTLKTKALQGVDADDIINLEVDFAHESILGIVSKVTTTVRGTAVKYR